MSTMQEHRDSMLREQMVMELRTLNVLLAMKIKDPSPDAAVEFIKDLQKGFEFDKEYDSRYDFRFGKKD